MRSSASFRRLATMLIGVASAIPASAQVQGVVVPLSGSAPMLVYAAVNVTGLTTFGVRLDFGDGAEKLWYNDGQVIAPFTHIEPHEYNCPGNFTVTVWQYNGAWWIPQTWQINVGQPTAFTVAHVVLGGAVHVTITDGAKASQADNVVVDWGDGTPLEVFRWRQETPLLYVSPTHNYTTAGDYSVVVTNQYVGPQCGLAQGASVLVTIENPNPVAPTTWGRIKAFYR